MSRQAEVGASGARQSESAQPRCGAAGMRRLIQAHFSRRIRPAAEQSLRRHLCGCIPCRRYYADHMQLETIVTGASGFEQRLARGLGLSTGYPLLARRGAAWAAAAGLVAAAAIVLLVLPVSRGPNPEEFLARGTKSTALATDSRSCELAIYRVPAEDPLESRPVTRTIRPTDELAFAYRNGCRKRHLLVFAVDARHNVYWYQPAWTDAATNPRAIQIEARDELRELPEAIRHPLREGALTVYAVFTDQRLGVRAVEAMLRAGAPAKLATDAVQRVYQLHVEDGRHRRP